ncbi:MAG TPA: MauE/DoxX family redox-associated membrane protein [Gaiellaceae bacterium]|nr:MauE/DoxX family redox-associated membrane protein [Gaiellaceae bacterium]
MGLLRFVLCAVLLLAAAAKARAGASARDALRSYGLEDARLRAAAWAAAIGAEAGLAVSVALEVDAALSAAALLAVFALAQVVAIARGRAGAPCGCFGGRGRIGWGSVSRTALLGSAFLVLPFLPEARPSAVGWLGIGLGVALVAIAALAVALLALARELGELRLAVAPQAALSIDHEGPELGGRVGLIERFERRAPLAVAAFTSPGCSLCAALEPSLRLLATDPGVELRLFDEEADAGAWEDLAVPGSPYAVVLARDGEVLAKGTFNSLFQLESLLAHAARPVNA